MFRDVKGLGLHHVSHLWWWPGHPIHIYGSYCKLFFIWTILWGFFPTSYSFPMIIMWCWRLTTNFNQEGSVESCWCVTWSLMGMNKWSNILEEILSSPSPKPDPIFLWSALWVLWLHILKAIYWKNTAIIYLKECINIEVL